MNLTNFYLIDDSEGKFCLDCREIKARSEFYVNRARADGLTAYCAVCCRGRQNKSRASRRKPCRMTTIIWKMNLPPHEKVYLAIQRGARTQKEIKRMTRLLPDPMTDALARLYDEGRLDSAMLRQRIYQVAA